jgi:hypothetical protein
MRDRLSKAICRAGDDRRLRTAVKMIQATADTCTFEDKLDKLKKKLIEPIAATDPIEDARLRVEAKTLRVKTFDASHIRKAIRALSRQAAVAIDGWTRTLLEQAVNCDESIADDLAVLMTWTLEGRFGNEVNDMIRMGRMIGIEKDDAVRPIVISSIWMKLIGLMTLAMSGAKCSQLQHAINCKDGTQLVAHRARKLKFTLCLGKLDVSNAFNSASRCMIRKQIAEEDSNLRMYYESMAAADSDLAVYGPCGRTEIIKMREGMRQGDAASAFFFCKLMDECALKMATLHPTITIWLYMDDICFACEEDDIAKVMDDWERLLGDVKLRLNRDKCKIRKPQQRSPLAVNDDQSIEESTSFKILGACVAGNGKDYVMEYKEKINKWFDKLEEVTIHPQLTFTIARICGNPKILYAMKVNPPSIAIPIAEAFASRASAFINKLVDFSVTKEMLHREDGAGIPDYVEFANALYNEAKINALSNTPGSTGRVSTVRLVHPPPFTAEQGDPFITAVVTATSTSASASTATPTPAAARGENFIPVNVQGVPTITKRQQEYDGIESGEYLFYERGSISEQNYIIALALRLRGLPKCFDVTPTTCNCGKFMGNIKDLIEHVNVCAKCVQYTQRHNATRDIMMTHAQMYGLTVTKEPSFYVYESGLKERPDITFHVTPPITTDITIVTQQSDAIKNAEAVKIKTHEKAVSTIGHNFIPAAIGHLGKRGKGTEKLIEQLTKFIPANQRYGFKMALERKIACCLADSRARTIIDFVVKQRL